MGKLASKLNRYDAAVLLRMSPYLIKWFTTHAPKKGDTQKLPFEQENGNGELLFSKSDLKRKRLNFDSLSSL